MDNYFMLEYKGGLFVHQDIDTLVYVEKDDVNSLIAALNLNVSLINWELEITDVSDKMLEAYKDRKANIDLKNEFMKIHYASSLIRRKTHGFAKGYFNHLDEYLETLGVKEG